MNISAIINEVESCGGVLAVIDGELKGKNLSLVNMKTLARVKDKKADIIRLITKKNIDTSIKAKPIPRNHQVSCRSFDITHILMATKTEHCINEQGDYCGNCQLKQIGNYLNQ